MAIVVKNLPNNAGEMRHLGSNPELGKAPGGGHGNPLQYSCLENLMDRAWQATISPQGHKESDTTERLSIHAYYVEKASWWAG